MSNVHLVIGAEHKDCVSVRAAFIEVHQVLAMRFLDRNIMAMFEPLRKRKHVTKPRSEKKDK